MKNATGSETRCGKSSANLSNSSALSGKAFGNAYRGGGGDSEAACSLLPRWSVECNY